MQTATLARQQGETASFGLRGRGNKETGTRREFEREADVKDIEG